MDIWPRKHRLTVNEYYRMAEVGLLAPDARVELIEGEIIDMAPMGTDHAGMTSRLARLLTRAAGERAHVRNQTPLHLSRLSEPQPDLALVLPRSDDYRHAHPSPADVLLLVEVSDSSLRYDLDVKLPLYARHGISELWVVDLQIGEFSWYRAPDSGNYREHGASREPGVMPIAALPAIAVDLSGIFSS